MPGAFNGVVPSNTNREADIEQQDDELFVGIGTIINDRAPKEPIKHVFGSGVGYFGTPDIWGADAGWKVHFVRGPLTAKALGISEELAVTDPAVLVKLCSVDTRTKSFKYAFMPHWSAAVSGDWQKICHNLGIKFIDPRSDAREIIRDIGKTETLMTEALHGAIVADTLRIPWIAVSSKNNILDFKWHDWCKSLHIEYSPQEIPALVKWRRGAVGAMSLEAKKLLARLTLKKIMHCPPVLSSEALQSGKVNRLIDLLAEFCRSRGLDMNLDLSSAMLPDMLRDSGGTS